MRFSHVFRGGSSVLLQFTVLLGIGWVDNVGLTQTQMDKETKYRKEQETGEYADLGALVDTH